MSALTALWALPLIGAAACLVADRVSKGAARACAAIFAAAHFVAALGATAPFLGGATAAVVVSGPSLAFGVRYLLSADGLSMSLVLLTAFLNLICTAASWESDVSGAYWANFLALAAALSGVFLARDLFVFYIFWEATLIPMFFIIGLWGSDNRRHAAVKFFLFTFAGSVFMLLAIVALVVAKHSSPGAGWTWDVEGLKEAPLGTMGPWVFLGLLLGFGVKIPVVPLHTWLPDAHTEAPAAGSVMLAGVMLKMGLYGIIRVALPLFPAYAVSWAPWLAGLAAINAVYGALCAMAQTDLKRLIAYSSIAHLGFCLLGVFSGAVQGLAGGSLQMINHGLTTGALFLMVGFLYERAHKRGLGDFGGLAERAPKLAFFFGFSILASIGLPGLNGFVGEFMCLSGLTHSPLPALNIPAFAVAGALGVTLAAAYALPAYQAVFWSPEGPNSVSGRVADLNLRERGILWTLCGLMLWIGLAPSPWIRLVEPALRGLVK